MKHLVGHTKNGVDVYVELIGSEAAKNIARKPHLLALASEALGSISPKEATVSLERDMGRVIGYDSVVETTAVDSIFYAQLVGESTPTRFIKNSKSPSTQQLSIVLRRNPADMSYDLYDIWIGHLIPPRPGTTHETDKSRPYWEKHAVVFESQPVQSQTLTKTCPY